MCVCVTFHTVLSVDQVCVCVCVCQTVFCSVFSGAAAEAEPESSWFLSDPRLQPPSTDGVPSFTATVTWDEETSMLS